MKKVLAGLAMMMSVGSANAVLSTTKAITFAAGQGCPPGALCSSFGNFYDPILNAGVHFDDYYTFSFSQSDFVPAANGSASGTVAVYWNPPATPATADAFLTEVSFYQDNGAVGVGGGDVLIGTSVIIPNGTTAFPSATLTGGNYYIKVAGELNSAPVLSQNFGSYDGIGRIAAIPEPSEWALMLSGLGLMGFMARRRRNAMQAA